MQRTGQPGPAFVDGTPLFRPVRATRAFEGIAEQIRTEVAEGRLQVGHRLPSERALAEQFGVSRNTLREALRSLEHAGLVRLLKGSKGGAFISESSGHAITAGLLDLYHTGAVAPAQLTEARIWLEEIIVRETCRRASEQDLARLEANIERAAAANAAGDFEARAQLHFEFHRLLAQMTGNPVMIVVMNGVVDILAHFVRQLGQQENAYVLPSRRRLLRHLRARDAEAAVREMTSHLKRLQRAYLSRLKARSA